jgi:outer membrane protein OmpA-like peptidoglycan-associated protein
VREDLWQGITEVKGDGRRCLAPKMTAFCEVQLAWVDYEAASGGWRHVNPYVRIAEDYCTNAIRTPLPPPTNTALPQPVIEPAPSTPPPADLNASVTVFFHHDRWLLSDILPPGIEQLRKLANTPNSMGKGVSFHLDGYADVTGHRQYNERLSERRARSVAEGLQHLGISETRIHTNGHGSSHPLVHCPASAKGSERSRYWNCLEPNRRVVVSIQHSDGGIDAHPGSETEPAAKNPEDR